MNEKIYPNAVVLKRSLVGVVIVGVMLIMALIIRNLYHSTHPEKVVQTSNTTEKVTAIASESDTQWFQAKHATSKEARSSPSSRPEPVQTSPVTHPGVAGEKKKQHDEVAKHIDESRIAAMGASITSNQLTGNDTQSSSHHEMASSNNDANTSANDQNMQDEKHAFMKANQRVEDDYLSSHVDNPMSAFELQAGTIIPGVLVTGINSDLPGQITGQVRSNVYDSIAGKHLLVPQGAKMVGVYDSKVAYGQQRVLIAWQRIIFPNGQSMNLQGMPGVDLSGYSGFKDVVDNHYFKIFGSVVLVSALGAGAQLAQPAKESSPFAPPSVGQTLAQITGTNLANTSMMLTEKNINVQPTLEIRPGYQFNISVTKDMVFQGPYNG